ncbi:WD40-repeat-containing domain protein [Mycena rosella]|uniref:WD40-repeat-containing domain protein n=1 Tax=Mycena rosella TaxID=1033263 RepID=A0AAD7DS37_MYCRO|nr:WD40-repeat-containing domain protein [Mycena rosella]
MSVFPHSQLLFSPSQTVVISGPHIQLLDTSTGALLATTIDRTEVDINKAGPIRVAALDSTGTHLATSADDKQLRLWRLDGLALLNERELPKKPTGLAFTRDGQTILASDKFGDIFSYALTPPPQTPAQKNAALASHENPSGGALVLGHASFLTAFLLAPDEKFIVTADRDEHVRVSWFPQGYTIETYCLGHQKFVSALCLPPFAPDTLVSGGGDPMLKVWDWLRGTLVREIPVLDAVAPFFKVKPARRTPRRFEDDDGDGDDGGKKKSRKEKARAKHQRKDGSAEAGPAEEAEPAEDVPEPLEADAAQPPEDTGPVFALRRIEALQPDPSDTAGYLIFSAVGATALFSCPFSASAAADVAALDFGAPVLDFSVARDGFVWVSLDGQWAEGAPSAMVRVVRLAAGKLVELDAAATTALVTALNSTCLLPATANALRTLDLYQALSALPKNNDAEHDPMDRAPLESASDAGRELSLKELGRLKSKTAVAKKAQLARPAEEEEEREAKRARSEPDDVVMDGVS